MLKSVVWKSIDSLKAQKQQERARELSKFLELASDESLILFYVEVTKLYRAIFSAPIVSLYYIVFSDESNESGFVDFCSNLILRGKETYESILTDPNSFISIKEPETLNGDSGINVAEIAFEILSKRHSEDWVAKHVAQKFGSGIFFGNVWDKLEMEGVDRPLGPDLQYAKSRMPDVYKKYVK